MRVAVVGQVGRDLVLGVEELPGPGGSAPARHRWEGLGGKGANQAVAAAQLGADVALVGVVGDDAAGRQVLAAARGDGIDVSGVVVRAGAATALLLDLVSGDPPHAQRRLVESVADGVLLGAGDVVAATGAIGAADAVLVQLQQPAAAVAAALDAAAPGALVVADGAPDGEELRERVLARADVLRADAAEAELLLGRPLEGAGRVLEAARELAGRGPRVVVLDAGPEGNAVAWREGPGRVHDEVVPLERVPVVDPTGGGDTLTAALAVALVRDGGDGWSGDRVPGAVRRATAAAASTVQRPGGRPDLSARALEG
ncbi:PfkB family carbohydrate kinase [Kineococcus sp. SYSU DK004]|uniref:PfkB family carbohydrate kinase n=1 Tax=Kineococcus sp. SYSU DK004 TaxID=3383125 RepID=UPI003D7D2DF2